MVDSDSQNHYVGAAVSKELKRSIRVEAAERDTSMSKVVRQTLFEEFGGDL